MTRDQRFHADITQLILKLYQVSQNSALLPTPVMDELHQAIKTLDSTLSTTQATESIPLRPAQVNITPSKPKASRKQIGGLLIRITFVVLLFVGMIDTAVKHDTWGFIGMALLTGFVTTNTFTWARETDRRNQTHNK